MAKRKGCLRIFGILVAIPLILFIVSFITVTIKNTSISRQYPLHIASYKGDIEKVEEIVTKSKEDINEVAKGEEFSFFYELGTGLFGLKMNPLIDEYLWYRSREVTPIEIASDEGNINIVQLLMSNGATYDEDLVDKILTNEGAGYLKTLITEGDIDVQKEFDHGDSFLHVIVDNWSISEEEKIQLIELILNKGLDLRSKNEYGRTPLMIAGSDGEAKVAKYLIDKGAQPRLEDEEGRSFYEHVASYIEESPEKKEKFSEIISDELKNRFVNIHVKYGPESYEFDIWYDSERKEILQFVNTRDQNWHEEESFRILKVEDSLPKEIAWETFDQELLLSLELFKDNTARIMLVAKEYGVPTNTYQGRWEITERSFIKPDLE